MPVFIESISPPSVFFQFNCVDLFSSYIVPISPDCTITKFLNRILGLEVHKQNSLFQYFTNNFDYLIEKDKKEGKYDMGILGKQHERPSSLTSFFNAVSPLALTHL